MSVERNADVAQGEIVLDAYLVERRAELCEILDEQAVKMERYQRISASAGVLRDRRVFRARKSVMDKDWTLVTDEAQRQLAARMAQLARQVAAPSSLEEVLSGVTQAALDIIPGDGADAHRK